MADTAVHQRAGDGGRSGRYDGLHETAYDYAFLVSQDRRLGFGQTHGGAARHALMTLPAEWRPTYALR
jgi:hypothetical protein